MVDCVIQIIIWLVLNIMHKLKYGLIKIGHKIHIVFVEIKEYVYKIYGMLLNYVVIVDN